MIDWIVTSSLLILIIIALRAILKGRISLRLQYGLWLLVLIRLLIPLNLPSQLSVLNLLPEEDGQALEQPLTYVAYDPQSLPDLTRPEVNYDLPEEQQQPQYEQALQEYEQTINEAKAQTGIAITWKSILYAVWILGMIAMTVLLLVSNLRFDRQLKKTAKSAVTMGCHLPTYFSDVVATPCLFGLFKPRIYLTVEAASRMDVMQYVLTHELAHYQHKDHIWSVLRALCLVIHWYNPLVWAAAILSKQDAELCCDETAIKFLGEHQRQSYGKALIDMSCVKRDVKSLLITATTMVGSKKALKERILLIAKHPKTAVYTLILVILVAAIAVGCTFTGQQTEPADTTPSTEPSSETTNPTEPAPTGYPEGEIQFTLAYINGQPYIQDPTWAPQKDIPVGYAHIGVVRKEDNTTPPQEERHACHLEIGTSLYASSEDDTYIFYWRYPQKENKVYRMIRLDQTSIEIEYPFRETEVTTQPTEESTQQNPEQEKLDYYQQLFAYSTPNTNYYAMALTSLYESPEQVDLGQLFYTGVPIQGNTTITDAEKAYLVSQGFEPMMGIQRTAAANFDVILQTHFGITFEQSEKVGLDEMTYWAETDCYYTNHNDFNGVSISVIDVQETDDGKILVYYQYPDVQYPRFGKEGDILVVTLRPGDNGFPYVVSNQLASYTPSAD